jgi:hypothetical protein
MVWNRTYCKLVHFVFGFPLLSSLRFGGFKGYCSGGRLQVDQVACYVVTMFLLPKGGDSSGWHRITDTCCKC